jgi:prevent-host-death family protein
MTKTMSVREARSNFSEVLGSVHYTNEPVIVERNGKPYAVLVSPQMYRAMQAEEERDWKLINELRDRNAHLDPDEVFADITLAVEEVRQEMYDERQRQVTDSR